MTVDDTFAYIPLFAIAVVAVILLVLLAIIRKRSTARVSFVAFTVDGLVAAASLASAVAVLIGSARNVFFVYGGVLFAAALLLVPYCLMLATFEPKKIDKLVPRSYNAALQKMAEPQAQAEEKAKELSEADLSLLDISRDFTTHASDAYASEKGMTTFLEYINKTIKEQINADGAAILMVDDFEDEISVKAFEGDFPPPYKLPNDMPHKPVRVATNFKFATFPLRDNVFGEIATSGRPELITHPEMDSRIYQNGPEEFLECGSYIIIPMKIQDTVIGVTAFARKHGNELFTQQDFKTASTLSEFATASIKNVITVSDVIEHSELTKETEIATRIQSMLTPAKLPVVQGVQLGTVWNQTAGVCGDYHDVIISRRDRVSFVLSDIAGKGMNSVVVMTMVRAMLRLVVNTTQSAGKILSWVNRGIAGENSSIDHFGSAALINYDPAARRMEFATGGIIPVYYYDADTGEFSQLSQVSDPIGVEKTTEYKDFVQNVKSGDIIVTYTDGLVEALNDKGQQYSTETLLKVIAANHGKSGKDIASRVKADIKNFCGNVAQHDDETLLVIKIQ